MTLTILQKRSVWAILFALFLFCLLFWALLAPAGCLAKTPGQSNLDIFKETAKLGGFTSDTNPAPNIYQIIGIIVNITLGFVGVIFLVLVIAGGFMWMTAGGNEEKVKKGRGLALQSVIGLAIVLAAYLLTNFVVKQIITAF